MAECIPVSMAIDRQVKVAEETFYIFSTLS